MTERNPHAVALGQLGGRASAKLTSKQVLEIRASKLPQAELAQLYNVTQGTISHIRRRITWQWLA